MDTRRDFSRFLVVWAGQLVSGIGTGMTAFALGAYAFNLTGRATSYAAIILCAFLPSFVLRPVGGVLADRFDRRLLIVIGDLGAAAGVTSIVLMMFAGRIELWHIYVGVIISAVFVAVHIPAYKASITDWVPPESYAKASGLMQLAGASQFLLSPMIAGILLGFLDLKYILIIDILTFLFAIATVSVVRRRMIPVPTTQRPAAFLDDLREGFRATVEHREVVTLVGLTALVLFYVGLLQTLFGPMVLSFTNVKTLGLAQSMCAFGMLVSSAVIGMLGTRKDLVAVLASSLGVAGLCFSFLGLSTNIVLLVIPGFFFFFVIPFINTNIDVLIRRNVANAKQGRVWSFISVITHSGSVAAYLVAGYLADHVFNPLFVAGGRLADSPFGRLVGVGPGRGIAFMFVVSGMIVLVLALVVFRSHEIRKLEDTANEIHPGAEAESADWDRATT